MARIVAAEAVALVALGLTAYGAWLVATAGGDDDGTRGRIGIGAVVLGALLFAFSAALVIRRIRAEHRS